MTDAVGSAEMLVRLCAPVPCLGHCARPLHPRLLLCLRRATAATSAHSETCVHRLQRINILYRTAYRAA
jgi:hypothetical protein